MTHQLTTWIQESVGDHFVTCHYLSSKERYLVIVKGEVIDPPEGLPIIVMNVEDPKAALLLQEDAYRVAHPHLEYTPEKADHFFKKGPRADTRYLLPSVGKTIVQLKHVISRPTIVVGDYTYYHHKHDATHFERENVLYHFDIIGDVLTIGRFCQLAMGTTFVMNGSHHSLEGFSTYPFPVFNPHFAAECSGDFPIKGDTFVGNDVWCGFESTILPGVTIGDGAVIGAGSTVTKDVPPYAIVAGTPAKVVRMRYDDETIKELQAIAWWDWPDEQIFGNLKAITGGDLKALKKVSI